MALVYDGVADVIYLLAVEPDDVYRFASVNRAFTAATGVTSEAVVGRRVEEILPESSHALVLGHYRQAIAERSRVDWEEVAVYPAGTKVGEVTVAPIFDAAGRCTHLLARIEPDGRDAGAVVTRCHAAGCPKRGQPGRPPSAAVPRASASPSATR